MEIEINGKNYPLTFGFDFIDYVNRENGMEADGVKTNIGGAAMLNAGLQGRMPSSLRLLIKGATVTLPQKPSNKAIEQYIDELADDDDAYNAVFDSVEEELGKRPAIRREMGITKKAK